MWKSEWCKGNYFLIPQHEGHSEPTQMIQSQRKFQEEDKDEDPASLLSSWNFGEVWTSLATWEQTGSPCLWRGSSLTLLFTGEGSWVLYEWLTELGLLLDCIKKKMGWVPVKSFVPHMATMNHHWSQIHHGMPRAWYRLMHCLGQEIWGSSIVIKLLLIWLPFF